MPLLTATGITKNFGGVVALNQVDLTCRSGRVTGLLGTNGSGKSTISKIITGVHHKDEGTITYDGNEIHYRNPNEAKANGISMVFQNLSLIPDLTVWQNIVLGIEEKKRLFLNNDSSIELAENMVGRLLTGLDVHQKVNELNPGEMQIVEIAKAISTNPKLLILDEPTAALESAEVECLFSCIRQLAKENVAIIFTSHRLDEVMEICDDIVVFRNGKNAGVMDFSKEEKQVEKIIQMIVGEDANVFVEKEYYHIPEEHILEVENINYGKLLQNINFNLKKGEVLGVGGLAGQGQNELLLALAGYYRDIRGKLTIDGEEICPQKPIFSIENGILLVPGDRQQEGTFQDKSILYNMTYPKLGIKEEPFFVRTEKCRQEAEEICKALSVKAQDIDIDMCTLSGGNQQKIVVGKWLAFDIKVLLLADPAKGVDIKAKKDLYDFILDLVKEKNMSVILYASDTDELISYCDRVLVMCEGQIVSELVAEDITEDRIVMCSMAMGEKEMRACEV